MVLERVTSKFKRRKISKCAEVPLKRNDSVALRKDLDTWLTGRTCWNHEDWMGLLTDLRTKGYSDLIDTPKGQELIGLYLENNKGQTENCS